MEKLKLDFIYSSEKYKKGKEVLDRDYIYLWNLDFVKKTRLEEAQRRRWVVGEDLSLEAHQKYANLQGWLSGSDSKVYMRSAVIEKRDKKTDGNAEVAKTFDSIFK